MDFRLTEEQEMVRKTIRDFCETEIRPVAQELDEKEEFPFEIYDKLKKLGLAGIPFPEKYGGSGGDWLTLAIAFEELGRVSLGVAMAEGAWYLLGVPIYIAGTEEQKLKYVPPLVKGQIKGAFALTEPGGGSDAGAIRTTARERKGSYLINGNKVFITNANVSDYMMVAARTEPGTTRAHGTSLFVVDSKTKGITVSELRKLGVRAAPTCEVGFEDVVVPAENLVGEKGRALHSLRMDFTSLRVLFGVMGLGVALGAYELARDYAKERVAFGKPIVNFQAIQFMLVDAHVSIEAARLLLYQAAWMIDHGLPARDQASAGKLMASETAMRTVVNAMQIFGGYSYVMDVPIQRYFRDAKVLEIGEGPSEIQRGIIARELGLI